MQKLLVNIYQAIRSRLCERRNTSQVKINRFATIIRTDILVRKSQQEINVQNSQQKEMKNKEMERVEVMKKAGDMKDIDNNGEIISYDKIDLQAPNQLNYITFRHQQQRLHNLKQQQISQQNHVTSSAQITLPKQSQYKLDLSGQHQQYNQQQQQQKQSSQSQQDIEQQQQLLIQQQIQTDHYERELEQIIEKFNLIEKNDKINNQNFWKHQYHKQQRNLYNNRSKQWENYVHEIEINRDEDKQWIEDEIISANWQQYSQQNSQQLDQLIPSRILQSLYHKDITQVRQFKYPKQLATDYPLIDKQTYKHIRELWLMGKSHPNNVIKQMNLNYLTKLTARSFRTLNIGTWLNDEIINSYLEMIDNECMQKKAGYRVLNSFFAETTFAKSPQVIKRVLTRKNINKKIVTIIAVNTNKHWLFVQVINQKIIIHDSIKQKLTWYETNAAFGPIFNNIKKFAQVIYGLDEPNVVLDVDFPQQKNSYDCGMFLLCGIKDIVREYREWSFYQQDINYKRIQVANQLLNQKLDSFRDN